MKITKAQYEAELAEEAAIIEKALVAEKSDSMGLITTIHREYA